MKREKKWSRVWLIALVACGLSAQTLGCVAPETQEEPEGLEILGMWEDTFGGGMSSGPMTISKESWRDSAIIEFDNEANFVITQNPADSSFGPNQYNKTVWLEPDATGFYYCQIVFGKETLDEVKAATEMAASSGELDDEGSGGIGWGKAVPPGS